ncbi:MAG TPA: LytTR family transcriptional regulator DNA-binding domain-containing protein [Chitinophagaceae bacterium]|nr:LytTR family transcriptional regulator DNA-binding domain-containing protein [Chitinophagaceae bacterium]
MKSYQTESGGEMSFEQSSSSSTKESKFFNKESSRLFQPPAVLPKPVTESPRTEDIFRLFVKHFDYVYARPNDIIMIESCDHLVKVYVGVGEKAKLTLRHNTLKDFLSKLPSTHFLRIGRFCAINIKRLTGGNCNEQVFEFDFKISVKLKHFVSHTVFTRIGI